jgi:hypothetical protein
VSGDGCLQHANDQKHETQRTLQNHAALTTASNIMIMSTAMLLVIMCTSLSHAKAAAFLISSSRRFAVATTRPLTITRKAVYYSSTSALHYYGSRLKERKQKKKSSCDTLDWEKFEFGDTPKRDARFEESSTSSSRPVVSTYSSTTTEEEYAKIQKKEDAMQDLRTAQTINAQTRAWQHDHDSRMTPELVARATNALKPLVTPERIARIEKVLRQRTGSIRFLFENP